MKYTKIITKTIEIKFTEARHTILWEKTILSKISNTKLREIMFSLSKEIGCNVFKGLTRSEWEEIFQEEVDYRKLYASYAKFIELYGEIAIYEYNDKY